ncbi:hypothetical protein CROQUDRAFT_129559 [Cronartium quercuum f. sp. fusiforme G11]|uniref:Uncharacterized protein n=1 Tax=Cronartium quercuum f. sp. fusiforme G11 TaxID=708437 RepID=A0A9P6NRK3_9BASI|nr:hypothetical protein CROQUDRAFT_129559 [Cronartium quercuum f. sp. fusiforme G11]
MVPPLNHHLGNNHQAGLVSSGGPPYAHPPGQLFVYQIRHIPVNPSLTFQHLPANQATLGPNFVPYPPPYFHMYQGGPKDGTAHYMQIPNRAYVPYSDIDHKARSFEPSWRPWKDSHDSTAWNQGNRQLESRVINRAHVDEPTSASKPNPSSSHSKIYADDYPQEPLQRIQKIVETLNINMEVLESINPIMGSKEYKSKNQLTVKRIISISKRQIVLALDEYCIRIFVRGISQGYSHSQNIFGWLSWTCYLKKNPSKASLDFEIQGNPSARVATYFLHLPRMW